jgi:Helix-turn-helix domain
MPSLWESCEAMTNLSRRKRREQERREQGNAQPLTLTVPGVLDAVPGLSRSKLYSEMAAGRLPSFKIGQSRVVRMRDLERWLDQQEETTSYSTRKVAAE